MSPPPRLSPEDLKISRLVHTLNHWLRDAESQLLKFGIILVRGVLFFTDHHHDHRHRPIDTRALFSPFASYWGCCYVPLNRWEKTVQRRSIKARRNREMVVVGALRTLSQHPHPLFLFVFPAFSFFPSCFPCFAFSVAPFRFYL